MVRCLYCHLHLNKLRKGKARVIWWRKATGPILKDSRVAEEMKHVSWVPGNGVFQERSSSAEDERFFCLVRLTTVNFHSLTEQTLTISLTLAGNM